MSLKPSMLVSDNNLIIQASLTLFLTLIFSLLKIPALFLQGLHTYIHPDDVNPAANSQTGIRAAIRRPGSTDPGPELKPRKKPKDGNKFEFDESKAQIFRLKLNAAHLQSRLYFDQFRGVFSFTIVALSSLLLHKFLGKRDDFSGVLASGSLIPILLGFAAVVRVFLLIARVSFERSASKRLEKQLSFVIGVLGFVIGFLIVLGIVPKWVFDFGFVKSLDGFGKFNVALLMGCTAAFLYIPATRSARAFWLGTDQIRCNLSIIYCGWIGRMLLYANYLLSVFTSLLWINPFAELLVKKNGGDIRDVVDLVGNVGMSKQEFDKFRLWCLLILGVMQLVALRANLQMFLNEAVLSWYQRLHASKVPDLDYSRAKVFLHNHYLCLTALQFFSMPALVLLYLGLSQIDSNLFEHFPAVCSLIPCSVLTKEIALFMAWWVVFLWAIFTSANLALYRRGLLYVS